MTNTSDHDLIIKYVEETKSIKHRMDAAEKKIDSIHELSISVNKLALNMEYMVNEQKEQGNRLKTLEQVPMENANYLKRQVVNSILTGVIGAILGALLALILK